ncbi:MAG: AsnC family transcriptional regulator [Ilumatobacter sp.]|uniref:helix-turn-helix transcriptional regulator n=1 Tax=Ilumatobacter sp. TaxID=1967498 RepID=UPI00329740C6
MAAERNWTFLTNHAHVLLAVAASPDLRLKDIAERVDITERTATLILADLESVGCVERVKKGRRNHYIVRSDLPLRHPLEEHHQIADLIQAIGHHASTEPN